MNAALLAEAITRLGLRPGQTYETTLDGRAVEVTVREKAAAPPAAEEPSQFADWEMRTIVLDIPPSPNAMIVRAVRREPDLPAPIVIDESDLAPE